MNFATAKIDSYMEDRDCSFGLPYNTKFTVVMNYNIFLVCQKYCYCTSNVSRYTNPFSPQHSGKECKCYASMFIPAMKDNDNASFTPLV